MAIVNNNNHSARRQCRVEQTSSPITCCNGGSIPRRQNEAHAMQKQLVRLKWAGRCLILCIICNAYSALHNSFLFHFC